MNKPLPDYYFILEVAEEAPIEAIRRAYRKLAQERHPDRGGTHEEMLALNEAYEVLSDPEARALYDEAFADKREANESFNSTRERAKEKAAEYPKKWADFQSWLDTLEVDFAKAKDAGTTTYTGMAFPNAGESNSALLFICIGGVVGMVLGSFPLTAALEDAGNWKVLVLLFPICLGAWVGKGIHSVVADSLKAKKAQAKEPTPTAEPGNRLDIISCPSCAQKLRLPSVTGKIKLTCPKCKNSFEPSA